MLHSEGILHYVAFIASQLYKKQNKTNKQKNQHQNITQRLEVTVPMTWRLSSDKRSTAAATASASLVLVSFRLCLWITYRSSMRSRWILNPSTPTGFLSREGSKCWTAASTCRFEKSHKSHSSTRNWTEQCVTNQKHFKSLRLMHTAGKMSHEGFIKVNSWTHQQN